MKKFTNLLICALLISFNVAAQFSSVTNLEALPIDVGSGTHDKSQSKTFTLDGKYFAALANSTGTHLWRLDGKTWTHVLMLTSKLGRADCKVVGNVVHIFVFKSSTSQLISVEYVPASSSFKLWPSRTSTIGFTFDSSVRTATIDVDGTGRMWLTYERNSEINVQWSDAPYATWSAPLSIASGVNAGDVSTVIAMPGKIGILWSNQNTKRWGFRTHADGDPPSNWHPDEVPASQSALDGIGGGMSDDHMNVKVASDGTLYCAVKTSYNNENYPLIALLVRRPDGSWDNLYKVSSTGTTPVAVLDEAAGKIRVVYSSKTYGGDLLYNESPVSQIAFGPTRTLLPGAAYRDPTTSKQNFSPEGVILTTDANAGIVGGVLASGSSTTGPSVPAAPALVAPANASTNIATNPNLSWSSSTGAETYRVQVSTSSGFATTNFDNSGIGTTSIQLSGLSKGVTYYWRAMAYNSAGSSSWSDAWSFTTESSTSPPSTSNLVGHWKMDEGSGATLLDASGLGNHAILQNTSKVTWEAGISGLALKLPGTWSRLAVAPNHTSLNITGAITIAAWIKPDVSKGRVILSKVNPDGYRLGTSGTGKIEFWFNSTSGGTSYRLLSRTNHPSDGKTWMHVAATYDGKTSRIYINGVEDNSATYNSLPLIGTNSSDLVIGALVEDNRWTGALDDVRLYNGALSASEIIGLSQLSSTASQQNLKYEVDTEELLQVYPNPFSQNSTLNYSIPDGGEYAISLYDSKGSLVSVLKQGKARTGELYSVNIDGSGLSRGLYIVRLETAKRSSKTLKLILER